MTKGAYRLTKVSQTPNADKYERSSETTGDKLRGRKGNSPKHRLRPPSVCSVGKDVDSHKQPGGWLGSSHP